MKGLCSGLPPAQIKKMLLEDARLASLHEYIAEIEPAQLAAASVIVRKWSVF